jgi:hypothetical protein
MELVNAKKAAPILPPQPIPPDGLKNRLTLAPRHFHAKRMVPAERPSSQSAGQALAVWYNRGWLIATMFRIGASFVLFLSAWAHADTVDFRTGIMPILSKASCNAGTCHGNANGKGGFKLSLRGQDPDLDHFLFNLSHSEHGERSSSNARA